MNHKHHHQQATARPLLSWRQRIGINTAAPPARALIQALTASWRTQPSRAIVDDVSTPRIVCCWHRELAPAVSHLLAQRRNGLQPGFLVSPSRDGEFAARVVTRLGGEAIRGSANRTGARALRDLYQTLQAGVTPLIHPDGPSGPALEAKSGAARLAQLTGFPLLPLRCRADRYWQLNTWDRLIIPKPFARIEFEVAQPIAVGRHDDLDTKTDELATQLGQDEPRIVHT
ncbi:lysophospholipid acyltransferase family protein [Salinisphaera sp. USBA-960]|nr:lysophospholipid acyltransferase family protein [Salifodinibacter halophilus]NNC26274.1 lysophospholipid acyltransferase family protein [Salifodinibacter halophilus]